LTAFSKLQISIEFSRIKYLAIAKRTDQIRQSLSINSRAGLLSAKELDLNDRVRRDPLAPSIQKRCELGVAIDIVESVIGEAVASVSESDSAPKSNSSVKYSDSSSSASIQIQGQSLHYKPHICRQNIPSSEVIKRSGHIIDIGIVGLETEPDFILIALEMLVRRRGATDWGVVESMENPSKL
jgi:hypothetical protein